MSWIRTLVSSAPDREATMVSAVQRLEEVGSAWTVGEEEEEESTGAITSYAAFLQHPENADSRLAACKVAQHKVLEHTRKDATAARKSWKDASELAFQRGGSLFHKFSKGPKGNDRSVLAENFPVVGHSALKAMIGSWVSLWRVPERDSEPHPLSWDVSDAVPFPPFGPLAAGHEECCRVLGPTHDLDGTPFVPGGFQRCQMS